MSGRRKRKMKRRKKKIEMKKNKQKYGKDKYGKEAAEEKKKRNIINERKEKGIKKEDFKWKRMIKRLLKKKIENNNQIFKKVNAEPEHNKRVEY